MKYELTSVEKGMHCTHGKYLMAVEQNVGFKVVTDMNYVINRIDDKRY